MITNRLKSIDELTEKEETKLFLTPKEVRSFPKYANASDEEVWNAITTLHNLALICYEAFVKEENAKSAIDKDQSNET